MFSNPYITVIDNSGYFGYLLIDSTIENSADPYIVSAHLSTPHGYAVQFKLIAHEGSFADTFYFSITVGTYHYLVWNPDQTPWPGQQIDSILHALDYNGIYTMTLPTTDLGLYQAIFVCVGVYPYNHVIYASSSEATSLVDYLNNSGGRMYLEGGDVWYYDPLGGGYDFCPLFGILATADGDADMGPIAGQTGTFTNGMDFTYGGENDWMDHIEPNGTGFLIFYDTDNIYNCGVANDAGNYRTVGTSFELGGLIDGNGVSTRKALLDSIMHFFGISQTAVKEISNLGAKIEMFKLFPNPFSSKIAIKFEIRNPHAPSEANAFQTGKSEVSLKIYDALGRLVRQWDYQTMRLSDQILWDGTDDHGIHLPAGIYFVQLKTGNNEQIEKAILVR